MKTFIYKPYKMTLLTILGLFTFVNISAPNAYAGSVPTIADSPCDALYYESLSSRAWLEAQREITQNQNLILKPDSVFEYTCFDRMVRELAVHAQDMLSETSSYGQPLDTNSMDQALQNLVGTSLINYINGNFGSKTTGDSYNLLFGHAAGTGISHEPQPINSGPGYTCNVMERVWNAAKCMNFASNAATDGFFTFQEYAAGPDKRRLPTTAAACPDVTTAWTNNLNNALISGPWTNDPMESYFDLITPTNCGGGTCACTGDPVPTGVPVVRTGADTVNDYEEHICLQPGCRYHPGGVLNSTGVTAAAGCYGR